MKIFTKQTKYIYGFQKSFLSTQIIAIFFINNGIGMHTTNALYLVTIEWGKNTNINENRGKNQELFVMRPQKMSHTQHHLHIPNATGTLAIHFVGFMSWPTIVLNH